MTGKRAGKRAGPKAKRGFDTVLLLLAVGVTLCVVAWGYLVRSAIDFGATARGGEEDAWWFLGLASFGAIACLFVGLILVARILRRLGVTNPGSSGSSGSSAPSSTASSPIAPPASGGGPRPSGGHRAAR